MNELFAIAKRKPGAWQFIGENPYKTISEEGRERR